MKTIILTLLATASMAQAGLLETVWARRGAVSAPYVPTASTNLVLRWSFNSGTLANVPDESGNGNYAYNADTNGPTIANGYASFTGNQYVRTVSTNLLYEVREYTMTFWMYVDSFTTYSFPFAVSSGADWTGFEFDTTASKKIYLIPVIYANYVSTESFSTGQWVFIAGAWKTNSTATIVIDGTHKSAAKASGYPTIQRPLSLGSPPPSGYASRGFSGLMDEARLYNRMLSSNEIVAIRNEGRP